MMKEDAAKKEETTSETESGSEEKFINRTYEEDDSLQEVYILNPNYTNISYNKQSDNESDLIHSEGMEYDSDRKSIMPTLSMLWSAFGKV